MFRFITRSALLVIFWGRDLLARLFGHQKEYNTLKLDLHGTLAEQSTFSVASLWHGTGLDFFSCTSLLRWAREDDHIRAVILTVADLDIGWSRLQSLRRSLFALRQAGKQVWVSLAEGGMREYYLASAADAIAVPSAGHLAITGIAADVSVVTTTGVK